MEGRTTNNDDLESPAKKTPSADSNFSINSDGKVISTKFHTHKSDKSKANLERIDINTKETKPKNSSRLSIDKRKPEIINRVEATRNQRDLSNTDESLLGSNHDKNEDVPKIKNRFKLGDKNETAEEIKRSLLTLQESSEKLHEDIPGHSKHAAGASTEQKKSSMKAHESLHSVNSNLDLDKSLASLSVFFVPFSEDAQRQIHDEDSIQDLTRHNKQSSLKFSDIKQDKHPEETEYIRKARLKSEAAAAERKKQTERSSELYKNTPEVSKKTEMSTSRVRISDEIKSDVIKRLSIESLTGLASLSESFTPFAVGQSHTKDKDHHKSLTAHPSIKVDDDFYESDESLGLRIDSRGKVVLSDKKAKHK